MRDVHCSGQAPFLLEQSVRCKKKQEACTQLQQRSPRNFVKQPQLPGVYPWASLGSAMQLEPHLHTLSTPLWVPLCFETKPRVHVLALRCNLQFFVTRVS